MGPLTGDSEDMSVAPSDRITPQLADLARRATAPLAPGALGAASVRAQLTVLTAFWIYVALSNVLYANSMQASLASVRRVFAPWDARVIQHLVLYPLFLLSMWRAMRTGWQPLWRTLPLQLLCALGFAVLASPALVLGEYLTRGWHGEDMWHNNDWVKTWGSWQSFAAHEVPIWIASITSFLVTYGFGLALVMGFTFYQRLRDSQLRSAALERALTQAHLAALRMQLSPHTLFNLLHTIRGQIAWDPPAAQTMVVQLGDLLRRLLNAGEREFSRLSDELQFVALYLELQQKRFADRLTIAVPARDAHARAWVPSLILQPLVENAVVHGLAGHEGPVTIRIEADVHGEELTLRVLNTIGPGRAAGRAGIGLANVRERLEVQFGAAASFSAGPLEEDLWLAEIQMPLLRDGPGAPGGPVLPEGDRRP